MAKTIPFDQLPEDIQLEMIVGFTGYLNNNAYAVPVDFDNATYRGFEISENDFWDIGGVLYAMVMSPNIGKVRTSTQRVLNKRGVSLCTTNHSSDHQRAAARVASYSYDENGDYRWRLLFAL